VGILLPDLMRKVGFIIYPAFSTMNFAVTTVFEAANDSLGSVAYEVALVSEHGGPVATSLGYEIQTSSFKRRRFDTIIIAGGMAPPTATPALVKYLRSAVARTRRIARFVPEPWSLPKRDCSTDGGLPHTGSTVKVCRASTPRSRSRRIVSLRQMGQSRHRRESALDSILHWLWWRTTGARR
jgi:hypothetical protein